VPFKQPTYIRNANPDDTYLARVPLVMLVWS